MGQASSIRLKIEGMSCGHCQNAVEKALKSVAGVLDAKVDLAKKEAVVTGTADPAALRQAVDEIGFTVVDE